MTAGPVWMDGQILEPDHVRLGVEDRAFLLGHAAFETLRWTGAGLRRWPAHRARLEGGLGYLGLKTPVGLDGAPRAAAALAAKQGLEAGVVRVTVSAGPGGGGLEGRPGAAPRLVMTLAPRPAPPASVSVMIAPGARRAGSPGERFKLSGYGDLIAARGQARAAGADRAVVTGPGGVLACADCANLFWISSGQVFTPALEAGALPGVTRAAVMAAADRAGLAIQPVSAAPEALLQADAAFMTNSVEGVTAIARVEGRDLDAGHAVIGHLRTLEAA
jgi:branched-chain amino acid aminotransferase